jgi:hypothetical protein
MKGLDHLLFGGLQGRGGNLLFCRRRGQLEGRRLHNVADLRPGLRLSCCCVCLEGRLLLLLC